MCCAWSVRIIELWSQELWKREFVLKPAKKCHSILSSGRPIFKTRTRNFSFQSRIVSQNLPRASPRSSNMSVSAQHWKATMFEIFGKKTRTYCRLPSQQSVSGASAHPSCLTNNARLPMSFYKFSENILNLFLKSLEKKNQRLWTTCLRWKPSDKQWAGLPMGF